MKAARSILSVISLYVAGAGIVLMMLLILAELVATKLFYVSLPYALEYSEYLVPLIAFWGASYTLYEGGHVRADILLHRMPDALQPWIMLAGYILGLVFLSVAFVQMWDVSVRSIAMNRMSFYPQPSPLGPPQLIVTIGLGLFIVQLFLEIVWMAIGLPGRKSGVAGR